MTPKNVKIAVIGDVHEQWQKEDEQALINLGVDLVIFVGDLGNESIPVVKQIAELSLPKVVVFGNHDAWFSATNFGIKKCPYDRKLEDRVQQQLDLLGDCHIGFGKLDFPQWQFSIVGSRPFSWGGSQWRCKDFYSQRYGVNNFQESADKIIHQVKQTTFDNIIFVGHNGPLGLGDKPESICGKDWYPLGGDFGDPDLEQAISFSREIGKNVMLVTFGHMHNQLKYDKNKSRIMIEQDTEKTTYLNAAFCPRLKKINNQNLRNFSLVNLEEGKVKKVNLVWVNEQGKIIVNQSLL